MKTMFVLSLLFIAALAWGCAGCADKRASSDEDPYLWLEDVEGEKALEWVKARNAESSKELAEAPGFAALEADLLKILDSDARIPSVSKAGKWYYNFWQDARHPKGVWRRATPEQYRKAAPEWETVLDLDALGKAEGESWVWKGAAILKAGGHRHALLHLSRGGADAVAVREFDLEAKSFVKGGFELPEAKTDVSWIDRDHIYVGTDFGAGSLTTSGYPRVIKRWTRGTPLGEAVTVFEGKVEDVSAGAYHDDTEGFERDFAYRSPGFYDTELYLLGKDGKPQKVDVPSDADASVFREWLLVQLRSPWSVAGRDYPAGTLLAADFDGFMAGRRELATLFEPTPSSSLAERSWTRHRLILNILEDVKNKIVVLTPPEGNSKGGWKGEPFVGAPDFTEVSIGGVDADESDEYFMTVSGYLTPTTLLHGRLAAAGAAGKPPEKLKELPSFFDASNLQVSQHFAVSKDGTGVPYFQVAPKDLKLDGKNPTLLYGYGGFEVSMTPSYSAQVGRGWLSQGGVYVVANIRGGGEYGPRWHQAALKANRLRAYEDFAAVAEDLIARNVASPKHLGAQGGSNGGLLMGNMITRYPQLFGAVVCQVPLLDMKRYSHLLAGASWMAEYGDPDKPEEWEFIKEFSAYQNVRKGVAYPPVLFMTSTRDDRVHPGHARKMMAKMMALGADVRYYENIEGGHGAAADNAQLARRNALAYEFLWQRLK